VARVVITDRARADLARLTRTHSLPATTRDRVIRSLSPLAEFPLMGAPLPDRWAPRRFVLGPWRWMLMVYIVDDDRDLVIVLSVVDGRSAASPTVDGEP
jgi:plasmid stabilization system protein ParE